MAGRLGRRDFLRALGGLGLVWRAPRWALAEADVFPVEFDKRHPYEELYKYVGLGSDEFACEADAGDIAEQFRQRLAAGEAGDLEPLADDDALRVYPLGGKLRYEIRGGRGGSRTYREGLVAYRWDEGSLDEVRSSDVSYEHRYERETPLFRDATEDTFGATTSYRGQLRYGLPYWRSRVDSASGIDVYGETGIAVGDIDGSGRDAVYLCAPGGLPNRLYRFDDTGTAQDITQEAGLGLLDHTSAALFADFRNSGVQDLVVLRGGGPVLFLNDGNGVFRLAPGAFQFATPAGGGFTSLSAADYDGDGKLDIYLCTYSYFQSEDQYAYPIPYHDARTGPPNFLFRNQLEEDGTGRFVDVTNEVGLDQHNDRYSFAAAWCDYDFDGHPELYVANDFGRNNLYKFDGERFEDIAEEAGVVDIGPGMSATWFDADAKGSPDLYVTNMWTAAGQRVVDDSAFPHKGSEELREAYRRHAKGNTLYRNRGDGGFREAEGEATMGRWAWSGDGFDFDGDGVPEIYVCCGMITNPSEEPKPDLMSFFWRQVVAKSPANDDPRPAYENGWNAINQLIREDYSWNGDEPNVFYKREDGRYADQSGVSGLDFAEDSRTYAVTDLSGDGRLDILLKSRLGPQVRALRNQSSAGNSVIVLALEGTQSNRDAIGAYVTVEPDDDSGRTPSVCLQAGSGFLSQHTKRLHLGIGKAPRARRITVRWPSGSRETLEDVAAGALYAVREGEGIVSTERLRSAAEPQPWSPRAEGVNQHVREPTWLLEPVPLPEERPGPWFVILSREEVAVDGDIAHTVVRLDREGADLAGMYSIFQRYLFDYRAPLRLPMALLVDEHSRAHKVYFDVPDAATMRADLGALTTRVEPDGALPFAGRYIVKPKRNYFRHGTAFYWAGFSEPALRYLEEVLRQNEANPKAHVAVGQLHLTGDRVERAAKHLERARELGADSAELWNNLGGVAMARENYPEAATYFERSLARAPDAPYALANLGHAYRVAGRTAEAERTLRRALEVAPEDAGAANQLGLLLGKSGQLEEAKKYFQSAIASERDNVSAINNLAVLYMQLGQPGDAIAALQYGIRTVPGGEETYMNLARVYVQRGERDRAVQTLRQLLDAVPGSKVATNALRELGEL